MVKHPLWLYGLDDSWNKSEFGEHVIQKGDISPSAQYESQNPKTALMALEEVSQTPKSNSSEEWIIIFDPWAKLDSLPNGCAL